MARKAGDTKTSPVTLTLYHLNLSKIVCHIDRCHKCYKFQSDLTLPYLKSNYPIHRLLGGVITRSIDHYIDGSLEP